MQTDVQEGKSGTALLDEMHRFDGESRESGERTQ